MSYIGGSQFSVDNRRDNELFNCINHADMMEKIKADTMPMLYTGRVQANSSANYARNPYAELANANMVNDRDISLYQYNGFKDDVLDASSRATQSASRFNYAFDRQINKRYVDVSGQFIPNNKLRVLPNRGCIMYGKQPPAYTDANLQQLATELIGTAAYNSNAYTASDANSYLKYKVNRPKLTREDLMNASQQYALARPNTLANPTPSLAPTGLTPVYSARTAQLLESARRRRDAAAAGAPPIGNPIPV